MTQRVLLGILVAASLSMSACCGTSKIVPEPSNITLEAAMKSVGEGLKNMKEAEGGIKTGLLPSEVTVSFNVAASAADSTKLAIVASTPQVPQIPVSGSVSADLSSAITANRGNSITIKFTNILFAPKDLLLTTNSPEQIEKILKALNDANVIIYMKKP